MGFLYSKTNTFFFVSDETKCQLYINSIKTISTETDLHKMKSVHNRSSLILKLQYTKKYSCTSNSPGDDQMLDFEHEDVTEESVPEL